jgi:hypothetical protein
MQVGNDVERIWLGWRTPNNGRRTHFVSIDDFEGAEWNTADVLWNEN